MLAGLLLSRVLPAVLVKQGTRAPWVVLGADVHVGVLNALFMLVRVCQVIYSHSYAHRDGCAGSKTNEESVAHAVLKVLLHR